jgi:hypothetical protein
MAMTNAERQARWRNNHKDKSVPALLARIAELEAELARLRGGECAEQLFSTSKEPVEKPQKRPRRKPIADPVMPRAEHDPAPVGSPGPGESCNGLL